MNHDPKFGTCPRCTSNDRAIRKEIKMHHHVDRWSPCNEDWHDGPHCLITGNPCGTDTLAKETPCRCIPCREWLVKFCKQWTDRAEEQTRPTPPCQHECGTDQSHAICECVKCGATYPNRETGATPEPPTPATCPTCGYTINEMARTRARDHLGKVLKETEPSDKMLEISDAQGSSPTQISAEEMWKGWPHNRNLVVGTLEWADSMDRDVCEFARKYASMTQGSSVSATQEGTCRLCGSAVNACGHSKWNTYSKRVEGDDAGLSIAICYECERGSQAGTGAEEK